MKEIQINICINNITLCELYYNDKLWADGMPEFWELSEERIMNIINTDCFKSFVHSQRALDLQIEYLATLN